ncbi:TlpA family protein disulfide reductase [Sphingobacterium sp. SYP-B4668]|uniref:TlpA family protein disulfide reductase n=1 Tax=Sphingobacterium sp. SYP-B4668 TaxID=2996035 RepID=UPI0022DE573A|nr:TlpA disulfide reductase family protein [Sphingobacterium sp. SYP-B4668]
MRKRTLLASLCSISLMASFAQTKGVIKATLTGLDNDTIYIYHYPLSDINDIKKDTLVAHNNTFIYKIPDEPTAFAIIPHNAVHRRSTGGIYIAQTKLVELFTQPNEHITIEGALEKYYLNYSLTGNDVSAELSQFRQCYKSAAIEAVKLELKMDSLRGVGERQESINQLFKIRNQYFDTISQVKIQYINMNLDTDLSAYFITRFPLETFAYYHSKLSKNVREGMFGAVLEHFYQNYQNYLATNLAQNELLSGKEAPSFSLKDNEGRLVSLNDFKGKLIVLDFWGTWCGPCMQELPKLKSFYQENSTKVELVSIACLDKPKDWQAVIRSQELNWVQLVNDGEYDVSILYGVQSFPTKIIIDKDLRIVQRFIGLSEDFFKVMKDLLK